MGDNGVDYNSVLKTFPKAYFVLGVTGSSGN